MNTDQVKGAVKDAVGKAQRKFGKLIDSTEYQIKGLGKQVGGKVQKMYGNAKDAVKSKSDRHH